MPSATSRTSASTASHRFAIALMNEILVARNAFDAYLIISADAGSVTSIGALHVAVELGDAHRRPRGRRSRSRCGRGRGSRGPPCPRAGTRGSTRPSTSVERGAGLGRGSAATSRVEPTGIVDLLTTTVPGAQHRRDLAGDVLDVRRGRPRRRRPAASARTGTRTRPSRAALAAPTTNAQPPAREALGDQLRAGPPRGSAPRPSRAGDPLRVDVGAGDRVAEVGQAGGRGEPDVPRADDRDLAHAQSFTYSVTASRHGRSAGQAGQAQRPVVERAHRRAGRGPVEVGGVDAARCPIGSTPRARSAVTISSWRVHRLAAAGHVEQPLAPLHREAGQQHARDRARRWGCSPGRRARRRARPGRRRRRPSSRGRCPGVRTPRRCARSPTYAAWRSTSSSPPSFERPYSEIGCTASHSS